MGEREEKVPLELPGEVWRGRDPADHSEWLAVADEGGILSPWYTDRGKWKRATMGWNIARAWALAERARADKAEAERDHLKRREQHIIAATEPADGGQWRADIVGAIGRLRRSLDKAEAIAAAERALRKAQDDAKNDPGDFGPHTHDVRAAVFLARDALRAMGVEP